MKKSIKIQEESVTKATETARKEKVALFFCRSANKSLKLHLVTSWVFSRPIVVKRDLSLFDRANVAPLNVRFEFFFFLVDFLSVYSLYCCYVRTGNSRFSRTYSSVLFKRKTTIPIVKKHFVLEKS